MLVNVVSVKALPGFLLDLEFENGERRRFDMGPYLHVTVFRRLQNPGFFSCARAEHGTVTWPGEIDIAPETLYNLSIPLETCIAGNRA